MVKASLPLLGLVCVCVPCRLQTNLASDLLRYRFFSHMRSFKLFGKLESGRWGHFALTLQNSKLGRLQFSKERLGDMLFSRAQFDLSMLGGKSGQQIQTFWHHCFQQEEWLDHPGKFLAGISKERNMNAFSSHLFLLPSL